MLTHIQPKILYSTKEQFSVVVSFPVLPPNLTAHDLFIWRPLNMELADSIDEFLTHNPCYIPLHEPPMLLRNPSMSMVCFLE